jgi:hypothetical protein
VVGEEACFIKDSRSPPPKLRWLWFIIIIIIIIIYFLPIAKDVTNTETAVMYGLRITQTA